MIDIPTVTVSVTRFSGNWVNGHYVKSPGETIEIQASIQPMRGNEVLVLPEHRRSERSIKIYSETRFQESDEEHNLPADEFEYDGVIFQVFQCMNWEIGTDIPHYKTIALKKNGQGSHAN